MEAHENRTVGSVLQESIFLTLHDLAHRTDPHPLKESQTDFFPDAIGDELTLEANPTKQILRSCLAKRTTNTRTKAVTIEEVVSRKPFIRYGGRLVLIGKTIWTTSDHLHALHWFSPIQASGRKEGLSFSAAEHLYAAPKSASHRAHIFFLSIVSCRSRRLFRLDQRSLFSKSAGIIKDEEA